MATIYCPKCGKQVSEQDTICPYCNAVLPTVEQTESQPQTEVQNQTVQQTSQQGANSTQQPIFINVPTNKSNSLGLAGMILAILGIFLGWIPVLGWIIWFLGVIFSVVGVLKSPRGFAIAGLVISFVWLIIFVFIVGSIGALAALGSM